MGDTPAVASTSRGLRLSGRTVEGYFKRAHIQRKLEARCKCIKVVNVFEAIKSNKVKYICLLEPRRIVGASDISLVLKHKLKDRCPLSYTRQELDDTTLEMLREYKLCFEKHFLFNPMMQPGHVDENMCIYITYEGMVKSSGGKLQEFYEAVTDIIESDSTIRNYGRVDDLWVVEFNKIFYVYLSIVPRRAITSGTYPVRRGDFWRIVRSKLSDLYKKDVVLTFNG